MSDSTSTSTPTDPQRRISIDTFMANDRAGLEMFADAVRSERAAGTEGFVGPDFELRTEADWWAEVAAFFGFREFADRVLVPDRRTQVERRHPIRLVKDGPR